MKEGCILSCLCAGLLLAGCSQQSAPPAPDDGVDYREMLERSREREANRHGFQQIVGGVQRFQVELGRFPTNLHEIARLGYIERIPDPPPGTTYAYDPVFGNVQIVKLPPEAKPGQTPAR